MITSSLYSPWRFLIYGSAPDMVQFLNEGLSVSMNDCKILSPVHKEEGEAECRGTDVVDPEDDARKKHGSDDHNKRD